MKANVYRYCLE